MPSRPSPCCICGQSVPPPPLAVRDAVVCSVRCQMQLATIPAFQRCTICTRPLTASQRAERHCGAAHCRRQMVVRGREEVRRQQEAQRARAEQLRDRGAKRIGMPDAQRDRVVVAVVPRNRARASRLPAARIDAHTAHLRQLLLAVSGKTEGAAGAALQALVTLPTVDHPPPVDPALDALYGAACGACRGACCANGGTEAYLNVAAMRAYRTAHPEATDEEVIAAYRSYLPTHTLTGGCVYQAATGCTLPRDMRAGICNAFLCKGLEMLTRGYASGKTQGAYLLHADGRRLVGGRFHLPVLSTAPAPDDAPPTASGVT